MYTGSFICDFYLILIILFLLYVYKYVLYMYKYAFEICVYLLTEVPDPAMASSQDV